ncbi:NAD(P)H-hydrate dehydratase [Alkalihalobacterium alkalinitrilicum]|uniref:NAD(P)H-hydrate dehydratase n=1 Tax=Alkalihalobacterium alkalinitrilicum TaxID=427920 RepID=UPI000995006C|nr:NAD(P)H-hydrate dehydratase [Alkalihalobacterium alkalinitrilicum]
MRIVTAAEMYDIDAYTVQKIGFSEDMLMENAGQAIASRVMKEINDHKKISILVGVGNNGGDGFVIGRILKSFDFQVDIWVIPPKEKIKGIAKQAFEVYKRSGYDVHFYSQNEQHFNSLLPNYDVIIDCLLGIGVKGTLRSPYKEIIKKVNACKVARVISVDIPSGVSADGGEVNEAIQADLTVTIQAPKMGAYTYPSASFYGEMIVADIGIPPIAIEHCSQERFVWTEKFVQKHFPTRPPNSHKGVNGKGMIIGGSQSMPGAVMLSAKSALRSGAGLLTVAIPDVIHPVAAAHFLEAMYFPCPTEQGYFNGSLDIDFARFDAIAIGPGMGRTQGGEVIVKNVLQQQVPIVIDADALYHLKKMLPLLKNRDLVTILTPHPGEMAHLTGLSIQEVEQNRFELSKQFAMEYGVYLVLKGPFTIVSTPEGKQYVNPTGNQALAKGGSGDILTGIILAFLMQHGKTQTAICNAVYVHGKTAELLVQAKHTHLDVLATDIIEYIPKTLKVLQHKESL